MFIYALSGAKTRTGTHAGRRSGERTPLCKLVVTPESCARREFFNHTVYHVVALMTLPVLPFQPGSPLFQMGVVLLKPP